MAYCVETFKYYGDDICCIDISIKEKFHKSYYVLVSEYEPALMVLKSVYTRERLIG